MQSVRIHFMSLDEYDRLIREKRFKDADAVGIDKFRDQMRDKHGRRSPVRSIA